MYGTSKGMPCLQIDIASTKQFLFHLFTHSIQGELQKPRKLYEMTRSVLTQSKKYATSTYYYYNVRMKLMCQFYHHY